jgi:hypothetical protein
VIPVHPTPPARSPAARWICASLLLVDVLAGLVVVYFFLLGLADGTVSSANAGLWLMILAGLAVIVAGGIALYQAGKPALSALLLLLLAGPALLYAFFLMMVLILQPSWN